MKGRTWLGIELPFHGRARCGGELGAAVCHKDKRASECQGLCHADKARRLAAQSFARYAEGIMLRGDHDLTIIADTDFRSVHRPFGIRRADRRTHVYIVGKTGTGKSTLIAKLCRQDLQRGEGLALLDPHGDLVQAVLGMVPPERQGDLVYLNVPDREHPVAFNPLEAMGDRAKPLVASGLLSAFKKLWADSWGPRTEYILRNALLTLLDLPTATLFDIPRLLDEPGFRAQALTQGTNPHVRRFWEREYEKYPARLRADAIAPIQNKVGEFLVNPFLQPILGQPKSAFNAHTLMDQGGILLVNLAKGRIGEDTAALLGTLLVNHLGVAALGRSDVPEEDRRDFYLYADEFPSFTTSAFAGMLAEMRKYRLCLALAHQHLGQLDESVRDAMLGNVGTMIAFRLGPQDADLLVKEFQPEFGAADLLHLPNHCAYVRLMVGGVVSRPFSARTIPGSAEPILRVSMKTARDTPVGRGHGHSSP